ncbi:hypothetical protein JJB99_06480 [Bradyrhizobium diazoefficiens]|uniref:hypothetical protein n=1 Tax=Bradyrhizobium diazoefficiens TaxID=1355477 RepID=UPI00190C5203|nr:hypothetical protein [Bradyrhizobium diazoefficiens]QQO15807.1 hypothetical protein JJB99_06480 [Bradyrhizobium diazoefficiens]
MIDKTLARMIDETLRQSRESERFAGLKMLEVRTIWAHLVVRAPVAPETSRAPTGFRL